MKKQSLVRRKERSDWRWGARRAVAKRCRAAAPIRLPPPLKAVRKGGLFGWWEPDEEAAAGSTEGAERLEMGRPQGGREDARVGVPHSSGLTGNDCRLKANGFKAGLQPTGLSPTTTITRTTAAVGT